MKENTANGGYTPHRQRLEYATTSTYQVSREIIIKYSLN